jgi:hypothetical protein
MQKNRRLDCGSVSVVSRLAWLAVCLATISGCSSWSFSNISWPEWPFDDDPAVPEKVVALWADTVLYQPDRPSIRGFGGRLMFFEAKREKPIKVDGTLVVYAFDETNRAANNAKPDRKYVFTPEQLPSHYSVAKYGKSKIGHSYSIWIPWDEVGGEQKEISLVVRFEPKGGGAVTVGQAARQILPGKKPPESPAKEPAKIPANDVAMKMMPNVPGGQPIQQVAYQAAMPANGGTAVAQPLQPAVGSPQPNPLPGRHLGVTTIAVPQVMQGSLTAPSTIAPPAMSNGQAAAPPGLGQPMIQGPAATMPAFPSGMTALPATAAGTTTAGAAQTPMSPVVNGVPVSNQPAAIPIGPAPTATLPDGTVLFGGHAYGGPPPQRSRFAPPISLVGGAPAVPPGADRVPMTPGLAGSPSAPGLSQPMDSGSGLMPSLQGGAIVTY